MKLKKHLTMKTMKLKKTGQYVSTTAIFEGTKKQVLEMLRIEGKQMRRYSRQVHKLPDNVHAVDEDKHTSRLVTIASFELSNMGIKQLLELLNAHGVVQFDRYVLGIETLRRIIEVGIGNQLILDISKSLSFRRI